MDVGSFLTALALGLVAGAIGRAVVPNDAFDQLSGWRSWGVSVVLGLVGAVVGYFIFAQLLGIGDENKFDWGGVVGAIIGAIIVVFIASIVFRRATGRQHLT